jgi:hypothetical protein
MTPDNVVEMRPSLRQVRLGLDEAMNELMTPRGDSTERKFLFDLPSRLSEMRAFIEAESWDQELSFAIVDALSESTKAIVELLELITGLSPEDLSC